MMNDCHSCKHKRGTPGDNHLACSKPDWKMTGAEHGIKKGWFFYPLNFDPIWATKVCDNFEEIIYETV